MTTASLDTIGIADQEEQDVQRARIDSGWRELGETPLNFVSRFAPAIGAS
jgi:hypothetical protein